MRIAIPVSDGRLCQHFGHCDQFQLFDIDDQAKTISHRQSIVPPPHEPGLIPRWLHGQGANLVIAGGMGARAQELFIQNGVKVVVGAPSMAAEAIVNDYLHGTLKTSENTCDH